MECGLSKDSIKQYLYELTSDDRSGEYRPNKLLEIFLENDFYDKTPTRDEGLTISNKEAGIEPSKKLMTLFPENVKPLEYEVRRTSLRESCNKTRKNIIDLMRAIEEVKHMNCVHDNKKFKKLDQRFYV
jgi:hypothetical protein